MKDFLKKYHNKNIMWNAWIIVASLVLAFGINEFLVDWTSLWNNLKASVINSSDLENKADVYLENSENTVILKNSKSMVWVENIRTTISYNPTEVSFSSIISEVWEVVELWDWENWLNTIIIVVSWEDIEKNSKLLQIETKKDTNVWINILNTSFKDKTWEVYNLSTSWIIY